MKDTTLEQSVFSLPLDEIHQQHGATFVERDGWRIPASYGDSAREYDAVRHDVGVIDLSANGRVSVAGTEAVMFLNGLITNDMKTLGPNRWMPAVFPNVQGRLIVVTRIVRLTDDLTGKKPSSRFVLETEPVSRERLLQTIERFTLAGDFRVADLTNQTVMFSIQGPRSSRVFQALFGDIELDRDGVAELNWHGRNITVLRATHTAEDGFDLIVDKAEGANVWQLLVHAGAAPVGYDALEVLRVEAGVPRYGRDMDESNVITEVNLDDAISYTKGCYIGQEIIIRIKHRGHVAKKLSGLAADNEVAPGDIIQGKDGKDVGRVTSSVFSPALNRQVALGYVRYEHSTAGTPLRILAAGGGVAATVTALPFVTGSWQ